jgi:hypothetical protein
MAGHLSPEPENPYVAMITGEGPAGGRAATIVAGGRVMSTEFVSEPLTPVAGTIDPSGMARGEPGLPARFVWRGREVGVEEVLEAWKSTSEDRGDVYVRRHWWRLRTSTGETWKVYFERQAQSKAQRKLRWWLHSLERE